jgi:uncharacterized protein
MSAATAALLGEGEFGRWLGVTKGDPWWNPDGVTTGVFVASVVMVVPLGAFWTACFNLADPMVDVDVALPARWLGDALEIIDLDLDVVRSINGNVRVRDQDEFELVRMTWARPDDIATQAAATCERLRELIARRAQPF